MIFNKNPLQTKTFSSIELISDAYIFNDNLNTYSSTTAIFDRFWGYTNTQSTGLQNIVIKDPNPWANLGQLSSSSIVAEKTNRTWNLNELRDRAPTASFSTSKCTELVPSMFAAPTIIDYSTSLFNLPRLRDEWMAARFYFKPEDNIKLVTDTFNSTSKISIR